MTSRTPWSSGFRILLAFALFALSGGAAIAYQGDIKDAVDDEEGDSETPGLVDEGEYVSPQFDVGITWTDAWAVGNVTDPNVAHAIGGNYDGPVASDPALGDIVFLVDTASESSVLSLGFSPNEAPVEPDVLLQSMGQPSFLEDNLFLSSDAEVLLLESNRSTAAILAREAAPNDDHLVYLSIVADPGREDYSFWVGLDMYEPDEYEAILTSMEGDIEVEANDIFDVFSPDEILEAVDASDAEPADVPDGSIKPTAEPEPTEVPVETEEVTEEPVETEEPTEEPAETEEATNEPVETKEATPESTESPDASPEASPAASPESPGLIAEGEYLSPQHDVPVTWTDAWTLDPNTAQPVQSNPDTGVDALSFTNAVTGNATVYITVEYRDDFTPREGLDALSTTGYIESILQLPAETEVVLSGTGIDTVAVVYVDASGAEPMVIILEANIVDDETVAFVELRAAAADIDADLLDAVATGIAVDGEAGFSVFTADEIIDALP